mgnify:CR=1 FL=1
MTRIYIFGIIFTLVNSLVIAQDSLIDITKVSSKFNIDIRYATSNNIFEESLYNCAKCFLMPQVAKQLIAANDYFITKGYRIIIYDCYRPFDVQKKMWEKIPRATYVANPNTGGSIHNKGAAIDISLEKLDGSSVNMGTGIDFFGKESHIDYPNLSKKVKKNRTLLLDGMWKFGFNSIRTEWWHFYYKKNNSYPTLNQAFPCKG